MLSQPICLDPSSSLCLCQGFSLLDGEYRTSVARQTRYPVWDMPTEVLMRPALAQDIANHRLMVCAFIYLVR